MSSGLMAGRGRAAATGGLPFVIAACFAALSVFLTRAFLDWNEDRYPWRRIYAELAYFLVVPIALGSIGWYRSSLPTFLLVACGVAVASAAAAGEHYASPLGYDNADSLFLAVFVGETVRFLGVGLLLPGIAAGFVLWRRGRS